MCEIVWKKLLKKRPQRKGLNQIRSRRKGFKKNEKENKAFFTNYQVIGEYKFEIVAFTKISKEASDLLNKAFERIEKVKKIFLQTLRIEFENLKMKLIESVMDYINRVITILYQME